MEGSQFLQYLFNRLQRTRVALFNEDSVESEGIAAVMAEQRRTVRLLFTDTERN